MVTTEIDPGLLEAKKRAMDAKVKMQNLGHMPSNIESSVAYDLACDEWFEAEMEYQKIKKEIYK